MYYSSNTVAFLDGEFVPAEQATCGVYAQSLHYGYAVFEGIRAYGTPAGTRIFKAEEHYQRLQYSCRCVGLPLEYSVEELTRISYEVLERNHLTDAYIRPLVYAATPNMSLKAANRSNLLIAVWEWGKYLGDQLLRLTVSPYERPNPKAVPIEAKVAGHYVNSIIASTEAKQRGYDEALLLDLHGYVAEGPGANFFFERNGELYTAPQGSILRGITRNTVLDLAREAGIPVHEQLFRPEELRTASAAFMTGTAAEVIGVASVDDIVFEKPFQHSIGGMLASHYQALVTGQAVSRSASFAGQPR
ncbi:branched-chain amino acid aminotransferase [Hymenobacter luteus]|uniref:Branched-chain-amino-acid aminotransferase n=2 Tax=Hymenobacter TaxID=89966 RepID=A0A7W9WCE3_9BACT|nr:MULTISPECIES: branched-chain amino acid transaminase [Hymenobacter]MBB4602897.1 branched-chain amino acid aminotransferase [Hymenobacter latericoloratus]MBB6060789.1 branched-chain amino acid aminotransferase [Hymenobacter luteus]